MHAGSGPQGLARYRRGCARPGARARHQPPSTRRKSQVASGERPLMPRLARRRAKTTDALNQNPRPQTKVEEFCNTFHSASAAAVGLTAPGEVCHVWTAPRWQGLFLHVAVWSEQPCVRPLCAVYMTAGHNALRGSGPGQKLALDSALAQEGCPDLRIDRICITCCSSFQPSHHADDRRDLVHAANATGSL